MSEKIHSKTPIDRTKRSKTRCECALHFVALTWILRLDLSHSAQQFVACMLLLLAPNLFQHLTCCQEHANFVDLLDSWSLSSVLQKRKIFAPDFSWQRVHKSFAEKSKFSGSYTQNHRLHCQTSRDTSSLHPFVLVFISSQETANNFNTQKVESTVITMARLRPKDKNVLFRTRMYGPAGYQEWFNRSGRSDPAEGRPVW